MKTENIPFAYGRFSVFLYRCNYGRALKQLMADKIFIIIKEIQEIFVVFSFNHKNMVFFLQREEVRLMKRRKNDAEGKPEAEKPANDKHDSSAAHHVTKPSTEEVKTGDASHFVIYVGLGILSLCGLGLCFRRHKYKA